MARAAVNILNCQPSKPELFNRSVRLLKGLSEVPTLSTLTLRRRNDQLLEHGLHALHVLVQSGLYHLSDNAQLFRSERHACTSFFEQSATKLRYHERRGCLQTILFLSQTLRGTIRLCAYRVKESTQAGQRDRDLQSHQPDPSGSCPFSRTTTCGHCHWDWAGPQARASSVQKIKHFTDSHKLSTATAEWRCLTPSLATGPRLVASAHSNTLPRTGILQEYLAGTRDPTVGDIA